MSERINGRTPDEWEVLAQSFEASQRERQLAQQDSWERSDTDGFLSQWASGVMAREAVAKAHWARNHGYVTCRALFHLDGTVASTHEGEGRYGSYWVLNDAAAERYGHRFVTLSRAKTLAKRRESDLAKGFTVGRIKVRGYVSTTAPKGARGLGGASSVSVGEFPDIDALRGGEHEVLCVDIHPELVEREAAWQAQQAEWAALAAARQGGHPRQEV